MKAKAGLIIRQIEDEFILVDSGIEAPKFNGMIKLNATSKFILECLMENDLSFDELVIKMEAEYDASKEELTEGAKTVIDALKGVNLIK